MKTKNKIDIDSWYDKLFDLLGKKYKISTEDDFDVIFSHIELEGEKLEKLYNNGSSPKEAFEFMKKVIQI